ncbi:DUF6318 family protein [Arthrobacter sp. zg-Y1171]|uniref:DUF6318 family protein n=1 Tax=Arthrobacter sp. zg-Y1171 TaxID=2964610 RepID=UPI00210502AD|nr:DUF6318 family protein [Arthrobacter sp. zg-Y1171]MCQ1996392.1 DUF6318 family protein [Arthrobacter sp. zg-Y1171]UWX82567.1 DUF6318 family protein [Arthrobacter sp. zg-Y1171]
MRKVLRRTVRVRLATVAVAVPLLFLTACSGASGDSGAGKQPSSPAATASETPTPTPTPSAEYKPASAEGPAENVPLPVMPEEAKVESKEGLEAFARYWYELVNYGFETGDVEPIRAISGPDCAVCDTFYLMVGKGYENDDWIVGGQIEVQGVHSDFVLTPDSRYQVLIQEKQDEISYFGPAGPYGTRAGTEASGVQMIEARFSDRGWSADVVVTIKSPTT